MEKINKTTDVHEFEFKCIRLKRVEANSMLESEYKTVRGVKDVTYSNEDTAIIKVNASTYTDADNIVRQQCRFEFKCALSFISDETYFSISLNENNTKPEGPSTW